jgi:hypothetical protein
MEVGLEAGEGLELWLGLGDAGDGETPISQLAPVYPLLHEHWKLEEVQVWPLQLALPMGG